eukprot:13258992-Alexandrium_andersonii.AAC.1
MPRWAAWTSSAGRAARARSPSAWPWSRTGGVWASTQTAGGPSSGRTKAVGQRDLEDVGWPGRGELR